MIFSTLMEGKVTVTEITPPSFERACDILIFGAGSAGCYAADSAARLGASVMLCEISENIGGMSVTGGVTTHYYGSRGGSFEDDERKIREDTAFYGKSIHWEQRQIRLTERLCKSGVKLLTRHSAVGLYFDEDRVCGVRVFDGVGCYDVKAGLVIDATSDGHLIRMTDVKKYYGRASDGGFVPFTVRANYVKDGKLTPYNEDCGIMNHYDATEYSKKTILARANAAKLLKNGEFVNFASQTGVREGLSFEGEETLRYEDLLFERHSDKVLFWAYSDFDRHGSERASEQELFQNWFVISNLATVTVGIPVPMGAVVPKGIRGLVSAGRCISVDTYLQSAVRMNRDMFRMGECIGVAAALAVRAGVDFLDVDYGEFLRITAERGCFANEEYVGFLFDNSYRWYTEKMRALGRPVDPKYPIGRNIRERLEFDLERNLHLLKTDAPGVAIWSAYVASDKEATRARLFECLTSADCRLYRYNCAIALGIVGDHRALPILREIVINRDTFFFTDNRRSNQFRSVVALCLLGRLGGREELSVILEILGRDEFDREMYHTLQPNYLYGREKDRNVLYFQMITHATEAAIKIAKRCSVPATWLRARLEEAFADGRLLRSVTTAPEGTPEYDETLQFIERVRGVDY